jgi:hypothetical protein
MAGEKNLKGLSASHVWACGHGFTFVVGSRSAVSKQWRRLREVLVHAPLSNQHHVRLHPACTTMSSAGCTATWFNSEGKTHVVLRQVQAQAGGSEKKRMQLC